MRRKEEAKMFFFEKSCRKICTYQKKAVPLHPLLKKGPLAQLNRVPHYGCGGCRFESCMDHKQKENSSESSLSSEFFILDVALANGEG